MLIGGEGKKQRGWAPSAGTYVTASKHCKGQAGDSEVVAVVDIYRALISVEATLYIAPCLCKQRV